MARSSRFKINPADQPLTIVNLILCVVIMIFGYWSYQKTADSLPLALAVGFGLFGLSHLLSAMNLAKSYPLIILGVRIISYLIILLALYQTFLLA